MREARGNLWRLDADLRCITTNGFVKRNGEAVMGAGCAKEARDSIPGLSEKLGWLISNHGNRVMRLARVNGADLASFPVKHVWRDAADPALIARSARQLVELADKFGYKRVLIPRPGCGNGRLDYADVRPILEEVFDDRFTVVTF